MTLAQKVLRLTFRSRRDVRDGIGLVILMFGAAMFEAVGIGIIMPFVSLIAHPETVDKYAALRWVKETSGATTRTGLVSVFGLLLVSVFLLKNVYLVLVQYAQNRYIHGRQVLLENHLMETYLRRPWVFHLQHNSSDLIHNVSYEVSQVFTHVVVSLFVIAVEALSLLVLACVLVAIEPVAVPSVGLVLGLVSFGFYRLIHKRATKVGEEQRVMQAEMVKWIQQGLGGVKEARIIGCEDFFIQQFAKRSGPFGRSLVLHRMLGVLPKYVLETSGILALVAMTILMFMRGATEADVLPVLGALAVAAVRILPSTAHILGSVSLIRFVKPSVEALWKALEPWPGDGKLGTRLSDVKPLQLQREIELDAVSFTYPNAPKPSLDGVSITIKKGESIAFVGGSGAGKTTIVDTVIGLLTPEKGAIKVDGVTLEGDATARWQRAIGYIPQTVFLSDDSIRRNIAFGVDDEAIDDERIRRALRAARLDEMVEGLPEGLDTFVGERGVRLSGGQRQRIGIARALYLDPKVLVLDEATSSLDGVTEREIVEAIEGLRAERTMIVIAHRLSTVRSCDRLVFMSKGKIDDVGTWDELVSRNADFRKLVELSKMSEADVHAA
ncbi:MAG: ABC transporter ATP-binding protein [Deltaproteobacteria bacterium]|nr:ABC transporter ATP-binding protein [Deltaproteobacteria bacterium]